MRSSRGAATTRLWERGSGSPAAPRDRSAWKPSRVLRLAIAALIPAASLWILPELIPGSDPPAPPANRGDAEEAVALSSPLATGSPADATETRTYAIALGELQGMPPEAPAGTVVEIWVAWDPPITKQARVQKLVPRATVEGIVPPVTPEGPTAVLFRVPARSIVDLVYGDRYGSLSVGLLG